MERIIGWLKGVNEKAESPITSTVDDRPHMNSIISASDLLLESETPRGIDKPPSTPHRLVLEADDDNRSHVGDDDYSHYQPPYYSNSGTVLLKLKIADVRLHYEAIAIGPLK